MRSLGEGKSRTNTLRPKAALWALRPSGAQLSLFPVAASIFTTALTFWKPPPSFSVSHWQAATRRGTDLHDVAELGCVVVRAQADLDGDFGRVVPRSRGPRRRELHELVRTHVHTVSGGKDGGGPCRRSRERRESSALGSNAATFLRLAPLTLVNDPADVDLPVGSERHVVDDRAARRLGDRGDVDPEIWRTRRGVECCQVVDGAHVVAVSIHHLGERAGDPRTPACLHDGADRAVHHPRVVRLGGGQRRGRRGCRQGQRQWNRPRGR